MHAQANVNRGESEMETMFKRVPFFYRLLFAPAISVIILAVMMIVFRTGASTDKILIGITIAGILILGVGFLTARRLIAPVHRIISAVKEISKGNLSFRVPLDSSGEVRDLAQSIESMRLMMAEVVSQSVATSKSLAGSTSDQSASLEETSSSLEQMTSMTRQNADSAKQANQMMQSAKGIIEKANSAMNELIESMAEIGESSEETQKIVKTIDEIAFQTNLLALNAAVEAARAGEAGAGFSVVAEEVRSLALRSAEAAKTTSELMAEIVLKVQNGEILVNLTHETFQKLSNSSLDVVNLMGEIAAASQEQSHGIEQINKAVFSISGETQSNASRADELASVMSMFTFNINSSDKAKALAHKAVAFAEENRLETVIPLFNDPNGRFALGKSELYVILNDLNGKMLANPKEPQLRGKNDINRKDSNGKYFVREMIDLVKSVGHGWIYYHWRNHETGQISPKKGYVQRIGKTNHYVLVPTLMT